MSTPLVEGTPEVKPLEAQEGLSPIEVTISHSGEVTDLPYLKILPVALVKMEHMGEEIEARLEPTPSDSQGYLIKGKLKGEEGTITEPTFTTDRLLFRKEAKKGKREDWIELSDAYIYPAVVAEHGLSLVIKGRRP